MSRAHARFAASSAADSQFDSGLTSHGAVRWPNALSSCETRAIAPPLAQMSIVEWCDGRRSNASTRWSMRSSPRSSANDDFQ